MARPRKRKRSKRWWRDPKPKPVHESPAIWKAKARYFSDQCKQIHDAIRAIDQAKHPPK